MLPLKMPDVKSSKNPINLNWHVGIDQLQVAESKGLFLHWRFLQSARMSSSVLRNSRCFNSINAFYDVEFSPYSK